MSDLSIICALNSGWNVFLPVGDESQLALCSLIRLPLVFNHICPPSKPLGAPFKLFNIKGDGNCLFRSFSYIITGRQNYHSLIRKRIIDHMKTIEHAILPHSGSSVDSYLLRTQMRNDGVWGSDIEILTAASLFCTDIYVFTKFGNNNRWVKFSRTMLNEPLPIGNHSIYIQNTNQVHFDVVKDVFDIIDNNISVPESSQNLTRSPLNNVKPKGNCIMSTLVRGLLSKNLKQFDVGGDGDCFFKAVSRQLYSSPNYHQNVRKAGIDYLCTHPEQFIESVVDKSWSEYINDMSHQGTWCDALMVQAVADAFNCEIDITESAVNFSETTFVHPTNSKATPHITHIGHLGEFHYVSTVNIVKPESELDCKKMESEPDIRTDKNLECLQNTAISFASPNPNITDKETKKR